MIATSVGYDVVFIVHIVVALASVVVTLGLRAGAATAHSSRDRDLLRRRFPDRINWAARVMHLLPVSGIALSLSGGRTVSFAQPWVAVGSGLYLLLAFWLEARVLPMERTLAKSIKSTGPFDVGVATSLARRLDGVLVLLVLAVVTMVVQY